MKSIIIYTLTTAPVNSPELYTKVGPVWVRYEEFNGTAGDALDAATPLPGESVSNSHPLPEPVRYRLLEEGEIIDARDEFTKNSGNSWERITTGIGRAFHATTHHPIRRALKSYEDAY